MAFMATWSLMAQSPGKLTLSIVNEQISLPFTRLAPVHPGLEISYQPTPIQRDWGERGWIFAAGAFRHGFPTHGAYLRAAYQWQWRPVSSLGLSIAPGLGYLHSWHPSPIYWPDESGNYEQRYRWGRPQVLGEVGFGLSLWPGRAWSPQVSYRVGIEAPFATVFPIMFRNFFQIGLTYQISAS